MRDRLQGSAAVLAALAAGACVAAAEPDYVPGIEDRPLFAAPRSRAAHLDRQVGSQVRLRHRLRPGRGPATKVHKRFYTDFSQPVTMEPGADLMLLHPDGSEELLVEGRRRLDHRPDGLVRRRVGVLRPLYNLKKASQWSRRGRAPTSSRFTSPRAKIVRLTNQKFHAQHRRGELVERLPQATNQGKTHFDYGVFNMGPCPLPGGKIVFTSNRDGFRPAKGYPAIACNCS
jgi:hypothetical protein